jgi:hypothetical protein
MPSTKDLPEKLRPFAFHGLDITQHKDTSESDCPFCMSIGKLSIINDTGVFRCVKCDTSGNVYKFLNGLLQDSIQKTTDDELQELATDRRLQVSTLRAWQVCKSVITGEWLIPAVNSKGNLANLYRIVQSEGKWRAMSTPGCKVHPFGRHLITSRHTTIDVCEGWSDGMAQYEALRSVRQQGEKIVKTADVEKSLYATRGVIAIPGAETFFDDINPTLAGCKVNLWGDNDYPKLAEDGSPRKNKEGEPMRPGWDGMAKAIDVMALAHKLPKAVQRVCWHNFAGELPKVDVKGNVLADKLTIKPAKKVKGHHPELPDGFDLRDVHKLFSPTQAIKLLDDLLEKVKVVPNGKSEESQVMLEPIHRATFGQLVADYHHSLHFTKQMEETLALMLAVCLSTDLGGEQLWFRVIGPPGSGKTTLAEALSAAREYTFPTSLLTGFHSGYTGGHHGPQEDASLLPKMQGKTVIIKDADTLVNSTGRDRILSELRDIYDGTSRSNYRNRISNNYEDIRMTFILCGTDELRGLNRSFLGERFLDCEIFNDGETRPFLEMAIDNAMRKVTASILPKEDEAISEDRMTILKQTTYGFLKHLKTTLSTMSPPTLTTDSRERLLALGELLSYLRARVKREVGGEIAYRPRPELATRLVGQLTKLAITLSLVFNKPTIDDDVCHLIAKVVMDTAKGLHREVIEELIRTGGCAAKQLELAVRIPETSIRTMLNDMLELGMVQRRSRPNNSGQGGRDLHIWELTPKVTKLWQLATGLAGRTMSRVPISKQAKAEEARAIAKRSPKPKRKPADVSKLRKAVATTNKKSSRRK